MADRIHIDPIPVREAQKRLSTSIKDMQAGNGAAEALLWFSSRIKAGAKSRDMLIITASANDSERTGNDASRLLQAAAQHFHDAILLKAIEIAKAQLASAEKARKEMGG